MDPLCGENFLLITELYVKRVCKYCNAYIIISLLANSINLVLLIVLDNIRILHK